MAIHLVSGDDANLLEQKVREVVAECVGEQSAEMVITRFEETDYEQQRNDAEAVGTGGTAGTGGEMSLAPLLIAAETPPMYEPFRVIEARHLGHFSKAADLTALLDYLESPLDTTSLVLVWEKGLKKTGRLAPLNKKLKDAVVAAGGTVSSASKPRGYRGIQDWFGNQMRESGLSLDGAAQNLIQTHLGEDYGRLRSFFEILRSAFGAESQLSAKDVAPFLGSKGSVPSWDLTSALANGDGAGALNILKRKFDSGDEPIAILYFLINHYNRIAMLDGAGFQSGDQAAKELGISVYPAKLALAESQQLGTHKIKRISALLGKADEDIKGGSGLDSELIVEILIARLAQQYRLRAQSAA